MENVPATPDEAVPAAIPTPPVELPKKLSEEDRLKVILSREKGQRIESQIQLINMQGQMLQREQAGAQLESDALGKVLREKYSLAAGDALQEDGTIVRTPAQK